MAMTDITTLAEDIRDEIASAMDEADLVYKKDAEGNDIEIQQTRVYQIAGIIGTAVAGKVVAYIKANAEVNDGAII